ncbi:MAG: Gfo/Idh/MocA family oxidoreductase [Pirellulales bacterium]
MAVVCLGEPASCAAAEDITKPVRVGILGFDNYQGLAFAQLFNSPQADGELVGLRVTAVYPEPCPDYPESEALTKRWQESVAKWGVEGSNNVLRTYHPVRMVDSVEALLAEVDAVMIASLDGRLHRRQAEPVLKAGKRLFITRPIAASLEDTRAILELSRQTGTPMFSSSQHRYSPGFAGMRNHPEVGRVLGCDVYGGFEIKGPAADELIRPLHGIETLYAIMGPGVTTVTCTSAPTAEVMTLVWRDGRAATYRGIKEGKLKYSATVFGEAGVSTAGIYGHGVPVQGVVPIKDKYMGYEGIAREIAKFFKGGPTPVPAGKTLEIFGVMEAAERSRANGGARIAVADVLQPQAK